MKTLEHIIRDVMEGKCCCEKKKKSLEHTIRDKVEEGRNPAPPLNNDKFQGNQFNHINQQVGTINPPKKGHVSREGNDESTERMAQKEKVSQTRGIAFESAAEKLDPAIFLDPFGGKIPGGAAPKLPGVKMGKSATPNAKPSNNNAKAPEAPKAAQPAVKPVPSPVVPKPDFKPSNPPTKVPAPEVPKPANDPMPAPNKTPPTKVPEKDVPKPANDPGKKPENLPVPNAPAAPAPKVEPAAVPKIDPKPPQAVPAKPVERPKVNPVEAPKPGPTPEPAKNPVKKTAASIAKAAVVAAPVAAAANALKNKLKGNPEGRKGVAPLEKPGRPWVDNISIPLSVTTNFARRHIATEAVENTPRSGDRKTIEYVGRKQKVLARQAANKVNKIDESKLAGIVKNTVKNKKMELGSVGGPTKEFRTPAGSTVVINPPEKRSTLDVDKV